MANSVSIDPKWLKAAAMVAPANDIRYYLCGVCVEIQETEIRLSATDGYKLVVFRQLAEGLTPARIILPKDILSHIKPNPKLSTKAILTYGDGLRCTLAYGGIEFGFKPIDGVFPDYIKSIQAALKPSGERGHYNAMYMAQFQQVTRIAFGGKNGYDCPEFWPNGNNPALVTYKSRDDFFGVLMPLRGDPALKVPEWAILKEPAVPDAPVAAASEEPVPA